MFLEGVVGAIVPGMAGAMVAYKQKRAEQMLEKFMIETKKRQGDLEEKLLKLDVDKVNEITGKYFGIVTGYVKDEVQEEKIKYLVNGFINLSSFENINEDFVLTYYDTLKTLRMVDIGVLKYYGELIQQSYTEVTNELNIEYEQYDAIREKLARLGLFTTKRDEAEDNLYENLINMQNYLGDLAKNKKASLKKFKRADKKDSYTISKFGREFIRFFVDKAFL